MLKARAHHLFCPDRPPHEAGEEAEVLDTGKPSDPQIINEDLSSLDDLLSQVVSRENELEAADQAE